jgi:ribosomal 50S subunit-recycling heat shock protein
MRRSFRGDTDWTIRLDHFLRASRLIPRRTVAQELCGRGVVMVNGLPARAARQVRIGDRIELPRAGRLLIVRVLALPRTKQVSRHEASALYEVLEERDLPADLSL